MTSGSSLNRYLEPSKWEKLWERFDFMDDPESLTQYETIRGFYDDLREIRSEGDQMKKNLEALLGRIAEELGQSGGPNYRVECFIEELLEVLDG